MTDDPPPDAGDNANDQAIAELRLALTGQADLPGTLRAIFLRDLALWLALFAVAARMRFAGDAAERELAAFIARAAAECDEAGVLMPPHDAEILVRSMLGPVDIGDFDPAHFDLLEGMNSLLAILLREWRPAGADLDELLTRTASLCARSRAVLPGMALLDKLTHVLAADTVPEEVEPELEAALEADGELSDFDSGLPFGEVMARYLRRTHQGAIETAARLRDEGDIAGAMAMYREVTDYGETDLVPQAAYELGRLMVQAGDPAGAKAPLTRAADSGDPQWSIPASVHLGVALEMVGDAEASRAVFERVGASGDATWGPEASL
ncbi:MAG TPA: hypothetical protein VMF87_27355 [Streptosporangiaceae bacterium]|nr:hypothetical protein [Streptosporangiaceae bacterium]